MSESLLTEIAESSSETLTRVRGIDAMIKTITDTHVTMARAHSDIGNAFMMMAKTFEKVEQRQEQLERTNTNLYKEKGVSPKIFFMVTATLAIVIVAGAAWVTNTFIKASFTSFEVGMKEAQEHGNK